MKKFSGALLFVGLLLFWVGPSSADTTKLLCRNHVNGSMAGPMEIDLQNRTVYRFNQRVPFTISSVTSDHITMTRLEEVGGHIAVLDLSTGVVESASVSFYLSGVSCAK